MPSHCPSSQFIVSTLSCVCMYWLTDRCLDWLTDVLTDWLTASYSIVRVTSNYKNYDWFISKDFKGEISGLNQVTVQLAKTVTVNDFTVITHCAGYRSTAVTRALCCLNLTIADCVNRRENVPRVNVGLSVLCSSKMLQNLCHISTSLLLHFLILVQRNTENLLNHTLQNVTRECRSIVWLQKLAVACWNEYEGFVIVFSRRSWYFVFN
jgi:hypothetical protein